MNREIKFRAWNKTMSEPFSLYSYVRGSLDNIQDEDVKNGFLMFPMGTLFLEFTGLEDKNGKEIYEGDIVQKWEFENPNTLNEKKQGKLIKHGIWAVEWDSYCGFVINNKYNFEEFGVHGIFGGGQLENCEVIGNVYENPELLKDTKNKEKEK